MSCGVGQLWGKVQLLLMINQIQELCPALESLFLSLFFLPFACLLCLQSASLDKSDSSKGE